MKRLLPHTVEDCLKHLVIFKEWIYNAEEQGDTITLERLYETSAHLRYRLIKLGNYDDAESVLFAICYENALPAFTYGQPYLMDYSDVNAIYATMDAMDLCDETIENFDHPVDSFGIEIDEGFVPSKIDKDSFVEPDRKIVDSVINEQKGYVTKKPTRKQRKVKHPPLQCTPTSNYYASLACDDGKDVEIVPSPPITEEKKPCHVRSKHKDPCVQVSCGEGVCANVRTVSMPDYDWSPEGKLVEVPKCKEKPLFKKETEYVTPDWIKSAFSELQDFPAPVKPVPDPLEIRRCANLLEVLFDTEFRDGYPKLSNGKVNDWTFKGVTPLRQWLDIAL